MFYERLTGLINDRGISFYQLERDLGFPNGSIKKYANTSPTANKIVALAKYFNVTTDYLLDTNEKNAITHQVPQDVGKLWSKMDSYMQNLTRSFMRTMITVAETNKIDAFSFAVQKKGPVRNEDTEIIEVDLTNDGDIAEEVGFHRFSVDPEKTVREMRLYADRLEQEIEKDKKGR